MLIPSLPHKSLLHSVLTKNACVLWGAGIMRKWLNDRGLLDTGLCGGWIRLSDDRAHGFYVRLVGYEEAVCSDGLMQEPLLTGDEHQVVIGFL